MNLSRTSRGALAKYNPEKGLKHIAMAEAAEKHYARAKDPAKLEQAIRAKLEAQAEFVDWWDHYANKAKPGQPKKNSVRSDGILRLGRDGLPDELIVRRWRRKLGDSDSFAATFAAALARYIKILEELGAGAHVGQNTGENEWYTPAGIIEAARLVLGAIDLDPASTAAANEIVQASRFYSLKDNGLTQPWCGRLWLNPPYAQPLIEQFAEKLAQSVRAGDVSAAVVLVNNATETGWFHIITQVAAAVCFPLGRICFWSPGKAPAAPLQGQAVIYLGEDPAAFYQHFAPFGRVWFRAV